MGQVLPPEPAEPAFKRLQNQALDGFVDGSQKPECGLRIAFMNPLEISERIQFGLMPDKSLDRSHAASFCFFARAARLEK